MLFLIISNFTCPFDFNFDRIVGVKVLLGVLRHEVSNQLSMTFNLGSLLSSDPDEPLGFFLVSQPIDQVPNSGVRSFRSLVIFSAATC